MSVLGITSVRRRGMGDRGRRAALAGAASRCMSVVSAARRRCRRPALTIGGLGCADASAWHTFGLGAGLLVLAACFFAYETLGGDDE